MLELSKVLAELRGKLIKAQSAGEESDLRFLIDDIELELQVAVTAEANAKVGFKVLAFGADAQAKGSGATTQNLHLKLKIVDNDGKQVLISDKDTRGPLSNKDTR
jgi:hypothetical protein